MGNERVNDWGKQAQSVPSVLPRKWTWSLCWFSSERLRFYELAVLPCTFNFTLVLLWVPLQVNFRIRGWLLNVKLP